MAESRFDAEKLPLIARARFGAGRGAIVGAVVFSLFWLGLTKGRVGMAQARHSPILSASAIIAAGAIAGAIFLAGKPHVRTTFDAIRLATICSVPLWVAILPILTGEFGIQILLFALFTSLLTGAIWGLLAWKGGL